MHDDPFPFDTRDGKATFVDPSLYYAVIPSGAYKMRLSTLRDSLLAERLRRAKQRRLRQSDPQPPDPTLSPE